MSAITLEPKLIKAEEPATQPANGNCSREVEFRAALDRYIVRYAAEQASRLSGVGSGKSPNALNWLQPLRRLLEAIREICLFSSEPGDWRAPVSAPDVVRGAGFEVSIFRKRHEARSTSDVDVSPTCHAGRSMSALDQ